MSPLSAIRTLWQDLSEQILPSCCPQCGSAPGPQLCENCAQTWFTIDHPCPHCGEADSDISCRRCRGQGLRYLQSVQAGFHYHGGLRQLIRQAKLNNDLLAMRALARLWTPNLTELLRLFDPSKSIAWVTIPPSSNNPNRPHLASVLSKAYTQRLAKTAKSGNPRSVHFRQQAWLKWQRRVAVQHHLSAQQRLHNLDQALVAHPDCSGCQILLFDDILTSGATLTAAAGALRKAGAASIHALCLARTPRPGLALRLSQLSDVE